LIAHFFILENEFLNNSELDYATENLMEKIQNNFHDGDSYSYYYKTPTTYQITIHIPV